MRARPSLLLATAAMVVACQAGFGASPAGADRGRQTFYFAEAGPIVRHDFWALEARSGWPQARLG